jgi:hypothetical protein
MVYYYNDGGRDLRSEIITSFNVVSGRAKALRLVVNGDGTLKLGRITHEDLTTDGD